MTGRPHKRPRTSVALRPRLRVHRGEDIALGPGKVALLEAIERCGSLRGASEQLGMSYMRAWKLVETMNACFRRPLVDLRRGGRRRGGAALTAAGLAALDLYRKMESASLRAADPYWRRLRKSLRAG